MLKNRSSSFALLTSLLAAVIFFINVAAPAQATTVEVLYFTAGDGFHNRVYKVALDDTRTAVGSPTAITPATTSGYVGRDLASDGTYLYFTDNNNGNSWDLVRTDLNGNGRLLLASQIDRPQQMKPAGVSIFFTTLTGGLYRASTVGQLAVEHIFGPGAPGGFSGSVPTTGYGAFTQGSGKFYLNNKALGTIIEFDWTFGSNATNANALALNNYPGGDVDFLDLCDSAWIVAGESISGARNTLSLTSNFATWGNSGDTGLGINAGMHLRHYLFRATPGDCGYVSFWSTGEGQIYHSGDMMDAAVMPSGLFVSNGGLVLLQQEATTAGGSGNLANTGSDPLLLWLALGLLGLGAVLRTRRN